MPGDIIEIIFSSSFEPTLWISQYRMESELVDLFFCQNFLVSHCSRTFKRILVYHLKMKILDLKSVTVGQVEQMILITNFHVSQYSPWEGSRTLPSISSDLLLCDCSRLFLEAFLISFDPWNLGQFSFGSQVNVKIWLIAQSHRSKILNMTLTMDVLEESSRPWTRFWLVFSSFSEYHLFLPPSLTARHPFAWQSSFG